MKKITFSVLFAILGTIAFAQNGLNRIAVEKYYVANAADSVCNDLIALEAGDLHSGAVTWRIYADMKSGYTFQAAYGSPTHTLSMQTSTFFFNNEDVGDWQPSMKKAASTGDQWNTNIIDSWISAGAGCLSNFGILKTKDNGVSTVVNKDGCLQNADPSAGIPISQQDGLLLVTGRTPGAVTAVGFDPTAANWVFNQDNTQNMFSLTNGAWSCLVGAKGPDTVNNNMVLIAQITTDGRFQFQLNVQIGDSLGGTENYVASSPSGNEILEPTLTFDSQLFTGEPTIKKNTASVKVYPNPSNDFVTLEISSPDRTDNNTYTIYDINGRVLAKKSLGGIAGVRTERIDLSSFDNGMYFIQLNRDGAITTEKIIKN